jgi:hypothetical protein
MATGPVPTGIALPPTRRLGALSRLGGCQYADDTTLYCNSPESLDRVIRAIIDEFCTASGAQLNVDKSRVLRIGLHSAVSHAAIAGIPVLRNQENHGSLGALYSDATPPPRSIPSKIESMDRNLEWWRQRCTSMHGRARLANAMLSSKLWYHMQFEPATREELQQACDKVWRCMWGTAVNGKPKRGDVDRDRACAPLEQGGLGVIEPSVMHSTLKSKMVSLALAGRGEWWTAFSEALVETAAGTGPGTGFDGLCDPQARAGIAANSDSFWQQALVCWNELQLTQPTAPVPDQPWQTVGAALLVQRALRSCPEEMRAALRAVAGEGRQYLSDFYDVRRRCLLRPARTLTSVPALQRRNAALHYVISCVTPDELASLSTCPPPKAGQLCRLRGQPTVVSVLGGSPDASTAPSCQCAMPTMLLAKKMQCFTVIGPVVTDIKPTLWSSRYCACRLSPLLQHPHTARLLGEAENTGIVATLLQNEKAELSAESKVADMRHYFRALRQSGSLTRPACEATWTEEHGQNATKKDWELVWRAIASANVASYARSLMYRIAHRSLPLLTQGWVQMRNDRNSTCVLCGAAEETLVHLFCYCTGVQWLWALLANLAPKLGVSNHAQPLCRLTGLLGSLDVRRFNALLPAAARHASIPKIRKVALRSWTEMRALVLEAIWQARCDVVQGRADRIAALRIAEGKIRVGLRNLVYLHLPHLSPWSLGTGVEARQEEKKLPQHVWSGLSNHILGRRERGAPP